MVIVDDGGIIVLGGLIDEDVQESVLKVFLLGDILILGYLFKFIMLSKCKCNFMVFLCFKIVCDGVIMNEISKQKYNFICVEQFQCQFQGVILML